MLENQIILEDDKGNEEVFEVVLTFEHPETKHQYVILQKQNSEDENVLAYRYDEQHNLFQIESDEEWAFVEEVLANFNDEEAN